MKSSCGCLISNSGTAGTGAKGVLDGTGVGPGVTGTTGAIGDTPASRGGDTPASRGGPGGDNPNPSAVNDSPRSEKYEIKKKIR